jgi:hypothetical protein
MWFTFICYETQTELTETENEDGKPENRLSKSIVIYIPRGRIVYWLIQSWDI